DAEGNVAVSDLGSVNGVEVRGRRLQAGEQGRPAGDVFRIGRTRLRVRTAREVLAPEHVDRGGRSGRPGATEQRVVEAGFAVSIAAIVIEVWTNTRQPRDLSTALVTVLLATLAVAGLWIALWALASRVAFGESRWVRHAVIVFVVYAVYSAVDLTVEIANGALGLHLSSIIRWALVGVA